VILPDENTFYGRIEALSTTMTADPVVALIVGTGMSKLFDVRDSHKASTQYGEAFMGVCDVSGRDVLVVPRHGPEYSVPPHKVNYRAIMRSIKDAGASIVIATNAVGSVNKKMKPGGFVVPDQILDFTRGRPQTFYEGNGEVVFTDVTNPYSTNVRGALCDAAKRLRVKIQRKGVYVCTEGPRFETAAEIRMFSILGGDIVGMTGAPEVFLAREIGLEYATLCIVTNWAAGIATKVSHREVLDVMKESGPIARDIIKSAVELIREESRTWES
jgi:5'-methylthioadenosine phosphorylase